MRHGTAQPFYMHKCMGSFCPLQLLAHAGVLPHRIRFLRGRKHNYLSHGTFSYHFLSKEVKEKMVFSATYSIVQPVDITVWKHFQAQPTSRSNDHWEWLILHGFCVDNHWPAQSTCGPKRSAMITAQPLHYSLGCSFWLYDTLALGAALCQQDWYANIKSHAL